MLLSAWKDVPNHFAEVFKKLFVTDGLDGSEDHLVSDKLFALIGSDMQKFRKELTESPLPAKLLTVIKQLIPPKGIRRNLEGTELLDYVEDDPYFLFKENDKNVNEENESDDEENSEVETQAEIASTVETAGTATSSNTIPSLTNITDDPLINKANETSVIFKPHLKKMKAAFYKARRSVKKHIKEAHSNTIIEQEDEGSFFDILENM